ncbi:hypothetical protein [Actinomycetospora atypica]|uniref:Uncharacterized protein n=1 Tax=Actinomycetospora atypica TaxID=1290095 RepID=A0ABV9YU29_9PSEU
MTIEVGDVAGSPQRTPDLPDDVARIGSAALGALPQWRRDGLRDEALTAIAAVATRLAGSAPEDTPARRADAYVLTALLLLNSDPSSGALATDLVEMLS